MSISNSDLLCYTGYQLPKYIHNCTFIGGRPLESYMHTIFNQDNVLSMFEDKSFMEVFYFAKEYID